MAQPTPYARLFDLTTYASDNPAAPYNASQHDAEFNAIALTLSETLENLSLIQRDDGNLRMGIVTPDALNSATLNLMGDWEPKGPWLPSQVYAKKDMVTVSSTSYVCAVAHTSSTWAIDLAAGYWQPVNQGENVDFTTVQFTATDRVLGRSSPGAGAGEEIVMTGTGRALMATASLADARTALGLGTGSNPTFNNLTVANLAVNGLTASTMLYAGPSKVLTSTAAPTDGQLLIGDTGSVPVLGNITGTANQVIVTNGAGTIGLALPQNIAAASTPSFATVNLTNLSLGAVVFVGASSALSQDITNFVWDDTNNRLGIGTNAPLAQLHVNGFGVPGTIYLGQASGGLLSFAVGATDVLTIDEVGGANIASIAASTALFYGDFAINGDVLSLGLSVGQTDVVMEAARTLALRFGTNAVVLRGYRTFTDTSNYQRWAIQTGATSVELAAETAGTGADNIDVNLVPAGTGAAKIVAPNGVTSNIKYATTTLTASAGASVTATNLIPDGAFVLGVVTRITTTLGATGGTTGYQIGDGTDPDRWGNIAAITAGTTSSNADATAAFTGSFTAANNVVLTAVGGNFDGTGAFRVTVCYIDLTPPTS